jgi:hypothetical protein
MMQPVNDPMLQPLVQTHKTYGLITGLILVIFSVVIYIANLEQAAWNQWVVYGLFLGGLIMNAIAFSKANSGIITFGQIFSSGFKATAIISLLVAFWALISIYIFPELKERYIEIGRQKMEQIGKFSAEEIEAALESTRKRFVIIRVMGDLFGYLIMGLIFSLIAAAVAPKNKRPLTPVV